MNIPTIRQQLIFIRDAVKELGGLLSALKTASTTSDSSKQRNATFITLMTGFHQESEKKYSKVDENFQSVLKIWESVVSLYGEDPKVSSPEEFFGVFANFKHLFNQAKLENEEFIQRAIDLEKKEKEKQVGRI